MRPTVPTLILVLCLPLTVRAAGGLSARVSVLEDVFARDFAIRACAPGETPYESAWSAYEHWRDEEKTRRQSEQDSLAGLDKAVADLSAEIDALAKLEKGLRDRGISAPDDSLHALEHRRVGKLALRSERLGAYNLALARHYRGQQRFIDERQLKLKALDAMKHDVELYNEWLRNDGPKHFAVDLNRLLVEVRGALRQGGSVPEQRRLLDRIRSLRRRLADHTAARNRREGVSLILVEVLVGDEPCYVYLGSGSEKVVLSQQITEALGWEDRLGDQVTVINVDGTAAEGRRLYIPVMSYRDQAAHDVEATVMTWSQPGSDGLLGMSFLDRFEATIDKDAEPPLLLKRKSRK